MGVSVGDGMGSCVGIMLCCAVALGTGVSIGDAVLCGVVSDSGEGDCAWQPESIMTDIEIRKNFFNVFTLISFHLRLLVYIYFKKTCRIILLKK